MEQHTYHSSFTTNRFIDANHLLRRHSLFITITRLLLVNVQRSATWARTTSCGCARTRHRVQVVNAFPETDSWICFAITCVVDLQTLSKACYRLPMVNGAKAAEQHTVGLSHLKHPLASQDKI